MSKKYIHHIGKTPYYDVWKGSPERKNSRERIIEYAKANPGATVGEVSQETGVKYGRVKIISDQENLKLIQPYKEVY